MLGQLVRPMVLAADAQLAQTRLSPFVRDAINLDFFSPLPPFTLCPLPETAVRIPPDHLHCVRSISAYYSALSTHNSDRVRLLCGRTVSIHPWGDRLERGFFRFFFLHRSHLYG